MREYEYEPVQGLPEHLPEGEEIVWQGEPRWSALANRVFQVRSLALYFLLLIAVHLIYRLMDGAPMAEIIVGVGWQLTLATVSLGLLAGVAWLYARSTLYTLTNRRLVLRSGIATPMMINVPLEKITAAGLRLCGDGTGDILLTPAKDSRLYYMLLWPHVRLFGLRKVQPLFRGIGDAQHVARLLAKTVEARAAEVPTMETATTETDDFADPGMSSGHSLATG